MSEVQGPEGSGCHWRIPAEDPSADPLQDPWGGCVDSRLKEAVRRLLQQPRGEMKVLAWARVTAAEVMESGQMLDAV